MIKESLKLSSRQVDLSIIGRKSIIFKETFHNSKRPRILDNRMCKELWII